MHHNVDIGWLVSERVGAKVVECACVITRIKGPKTEVVFQQGAYLVGRRSQHRRTQLVLVLQISAIRDFILFDKLESSKIVGITSNKQGQSPIKKRARFIPPSIVNSSAQLAETYGQQCARTRPRKDKKIQLTHIQKRRSPRLKVAMANEEDNGVEGSEVEGDQNKTQNEEQQGPEIQEKQPSNIEASSEGEVESNKSKTRGPTLCAKSKYILHAQAERYVMKTINEAWRIHKCRVKSSHFTKYRTDAERLKNRPLSIPETQFKKLIKYWKIEKVKKLSEMNTTNRALQKWPHRVGPTSFARIRERLRASKENHDSPFQAEIFVTTRRGNQRKQLDAETSNKIDKIEL
ncbi:hypothetical protein G2W53_017633 [Senna tora]|uniref:Uncharacterized protein n=1 Tax=Senna tora TaxID=362788 RepID=A0A834TYU8_9FABA|nr:hypothetical protein G2W53_017633 [Senna tora]